MPFFFKFYFVLQSKPKALRIYGCFEIEYGKKKRKQDFSPGGPLWLEQGSFSSYLEPPFSHSLSATASLVPGAGAAAKPAEASNRSRAWRLSGRSQFDPVCVGGREGWG